MKPRAIFSLLICLVLSISVATAQDIAPFTIPSERGILFVSDPNGPELYLYYMSPEGLRVQSVISFTDHQTKVNLFHFDLSPDQRTLAFSTVHYNLDSAAQSESSPSQEITLMDLQTGVMQMITHNQVDDGSPAWSPDGQYLAYLGNGGDFKGGFTEVHIVEIATMEDRMILESSNTSQFLFRAVSWSPDGKQLVLDEYREDFVDDPPHFVENYRLQIVDTDGSNLIALTPDGITVENAAWLKPDMILALCSRGRIEDICSISIGTHAITMLTQGINGQMEHYPDSPSLEEFTLSDQGDFVLKFSDRHLYTFNLADNILRSLFPVNSTTNSDYENSSPEWVNDPPEATFDLSIPEHCGTGVFPSLLLPGMTAYINDVGTGGNRYRASAGADGTLLGVIPVNASVKVLDGPVCGDGYNWFKVQLNDGSQGWTAEGDGTTYWLSAQ